MGIVNFPTNVSIGCTSSKTFAAVLRLPFILPFAVTHIIVCTPICSCRTFTHAHIHTHQYKLVHAHTCTHGPAHRHLPRHSHSAISPGPNLQHQRSCSHAHIHARINSCSQYLRTSSLQSALPSSPAGRPPAPDEPHACWIPYPVCAHVNERKTSQKGGARGIT